MTVLLLGATGTIGPYVVAGLQSRNADIRVLSRDVTRAHSVLGPDVDIREGDSGDDDTIAAAAKGVDSVFLLSEHSHDMTDLQLRVIRALRRLGPRIVKLSGTSSAINPDGPYTCRQHWEIEQVLAASGQPWSVIRPNAFMQTLIDGIMLPAVRASGAIPNAIGNAGISLIDGRDIGEVCAEVLLDSAWHHQTLVLTGPRAVTFAEIAALVSKESGREVGTTEITPADVRENLLSRGMARWEAEHFEEMYQIFRNGESEFVTGDVERVLGRPPRTVEDYLHEHRDTLLPAAAAGGR
ncbi:NmrA family NAD(P)-binding protein [Amycolatopsis mongoliensis]|uniref:NmrA family NAD(P)-binding protein n=1 Tax=Amycolatopsis mongoliensis TaxID=715475 RepID=A0A9Y2JGX9_9PSEU|nr:NmrA family NAD(P)-binding protein [Amycolatopsis sp. 4-36]WIX98294.1 NmrA family NAD(P)-binding protein [Amycolatopsis sp. 4-36]